VPLNQLEQAEGNKEGVDFMAESGVDFMAESACRYQFDTDDSDDGLPLKQALVRTMESQVVASPDINLNGFPSVGSRLHDTGRCKPCAFYHSKGCNSGFACLFCHLCPANEKQRRKRLRRQMVFDARERNSKLAGHSRQHSNASAGSSTTCTGWGGSDRHRHHSRQWSTSTQESVGGISVTNGSYTPTTVESSMMMVSQQVSQTQLAQAQGQMRQVLPLMALTHGAPMMMPSTDGCGNAVEECGQWSICNPQEPLAASGPVVTGPTEHACGAQTSRATMLAPSSPAGQGPSVFSNAAFTQGTGTVWTTPDSPSSMVSYPSSPQVQQMVHTGFVSYGGVQYALVPVPVPQSPANTGFQANDHQQQIPLQVSQTCEGAWPVAAEAKPWQYEGGMSCSQWWS